MDFSIKTLGKCRYKSPLIDNYSKLQTAFVDESTRVRLNVLVDGKDRDDPTLELAGQRREIYFNPPYTRAAIVTCGGLCPGLNDVIRSIVMESHYHYGINSILGIRYGYNGLKNFKEYPPVELTPEVVKDIHTIGGTILGSSRGGTDNIDDLVDALEHMGINILFAIGGDGTLNGARDISERASERGLPLSVIGIPKTIDNDINYIQKSFGFETAFSKAVESISGAHVEANGAPNGIGIVKLMGRHSGFIAAYATLAMNDVNFVLVPEDSFDLEPPNGLLAHLEEYLMKRKHAVICVAEGAGQDLINSDKEMGTDKSGNIKLKDIGIYLKDRINSYFKDKMEVNVKYIDPSYIIRSEPACPNDSLFCALLGQYAVHAGMAGKTEMVVGLINNVYIHVPIDIAVSERKIIDIKSQFWNNVLQATGQPSSMKNSCPLEMKD